MFYERVERPVVEMHLDGKFRPEERLDKRGFEAVAYFKNEKAMGFVRRRLGKQKSNGFFPHIYETENDCQIACDMANM